MLNIWMKYMKKGTCSKITEEAKKLTLLSKLVSSLKQKKNENTHAVTIWTFRYVSFSIK